MIRVLVSGASGFIGRHVLPLLVAKGHDVIACVRHAGVKVDGIDWRQVDLLQPGAAEKLIAETRPSHLLHLAWITEPGRFWDAPDNADWVAASLALYTSFARHGGQRVVFAGTCAEYDWSDPMLSVADTPLVPRSIYGISKNALRQIVESHAERSAISFAWGRIFMVYGPHEDSRRFVPYVINSLIGNQPALCSAGTQERDLMHVADVAAAFALLIDGRQSGCFNVATGTATPLRDIAVEVARVLDRPQLLRLGARPMPPDEPAKLVADISALRALGFQPQFSLSEGLSHTVGWWRTHRQNPTI